MKITFYIPVKTYSPQHQNTANPAVWRVTKAQRKIAAFETAYAVGIENLIGKLTIHLCRVAPRGLDQDDNLNYSLKHVRDGIADGLGEKNDNEPHLKWEYSQRKGKPREHGVEVTIEIGA